MQLLQLSNSKHPVRNIERNGARRRWREDLRRQLPGVKSHAWCFRKKLWPDQICWGRLQYKLRKVLVTFILVGGDQLCFAARFAAHIWLIVTALMFGECPVDALQFAAAIMQADGHSRARETIHQQNDYCEKLFHEQHKGSSKRRKSKVKSKKSKTPHQILRCF
jgi:hypothetical protein